MELLVAVMCIIQRLLITSLFVTSVCGLEMRSTVFSVAEVDSAISLSSPGLVVSAAARQTECALQCLEMGQDCSSFSFEDNEEGSECLITSSQFPPTVARTQSLIFKVSSSATTTTVTTPTTTVTTPTTTVTTPTTTVITTTTAPCTEPSYTSNPWSCSGSSTSFTASAMLRLHSSRALVFTTTNKYYYCSSMNNIAEQAGTSCVGPYPIEGDTGLDPSSNRFSAGPPDAAVQHQNTNMALNRYFLFKGDLVYCYEDDVVELSKLTPCIVGEWASSRTTEERFGTGLPSSPDAVFGNTDNSYDFYFLKGNILYLSTGDAVSGSLTSSDHVHNTFPNMPCDVTAGILGQNPGEMYSAQGSNIFVDSGSLQLKATTLCDEP